MAWSRSKFDKLVDAAIDKKIIKRVEDTVRMVALQVDRELVLDTPVGNPDLWKVNAGLSPDEPGFYHPEGYAGGHARRNWHVSLNAPNHSIVEIDAGPSPSQILGNYRVTDKVFISNPVPYIRRLNEGHSTQAPLGFVEKAIQRGRLAVQNGLGRKIEGVVNTRLK